MLRYASSRWITALLLPIAAFALPAQVRYPTSQLLYVATDDGVAVVDTVAGEPTLAADEAMASGDWSVVFRTHAARGATVIRATDPVTNTVTERRQIHGEFDARAVSRNGDQYALMPVEHERYHGNGRYVPSSRRHTQIVVAHRGVGTNQRVYDLDANVEPEAFSADGTALFVIKYSPPLHPDRYRVARLDLATGEIGDVFTNEKELQDNMRGVAFAQAPSDDGRYLYTLYKKPNGESFVHVLDLVSQSANCIDLPEGFGTHPEAMAITTSEGGSVMVVDGALRKIAYINTVELRVVGTESYRKLPKTSDHIAAARSASMMFFSSGNRVTGWNLQHPQAKPVWKFDSPVQALYQGEDGLLYVATRHRLVAIHIGSVKPVLDIKLDGIRTIGDASAQTAKGSVQCAC